MIRRLMCRRGLHLWTPSVVLTQQDRSRTVLRLCVCGARRVTTQDVWSAPTRARVTTPSWADEIREQARPGGAA